MEEDGRVNRLVDREPSRRSLFAFVCCYYNEIVVEFKCFENLSFYFEAFACGMFEKFNYVVGMGTLLVLS